MIKKFLLKRKKSNALFETKADIKFIATYKKTDLDFDEGKSRKELKAEQEKGDKADAVRIGVLATQIAKSQSVKKEMEQLRELEIGLTNYISLL